LLSNDTFSSDKASCEDTDSKSFSSITVGVADLDNAIDLWVGRFGFAIRKQTSGADADLARLWGIPASDVSRQALVQMPGRSQGMIHFVEFDDPAPPVRQGASTFDACAKNIDIYVDDIATQVRQLRALGHQFRSERYSELTGPSGRRVRKIQLPAHDQVNVVMLDIIDGDMSFPSAGFLGVGSVVTVVKDVASESSFYEDILGLDELGQSSLSGPDIEATVGLPKGAALQFSILGNVDILEGRVEVISYSSVEGANLYARARPKASGILHMSYAVTDLDALVSRLLANKVPFKKHGVVSTLALYGDTVSFRSPAGFRIEAVQQA